MLEQHIALGAGVTVAAIRVPIEEASEFGVIETDGESRTIGAFREKPKDPVGLADSPGEVLASMGNYIFSADVLDGRGHPRRRRPDLGARHRRQHHPRRSSRAGRRASGTSRTATVPGASERDLRYWRDVGTLDAYYDAHMDLISVDPSFNLYNSEWPILTWPEQLPPAKFVFEEEGRIGAAMNSMVCAGVVVSGGTVRRSILSPGVHVHSQALVEGCVVMHDADIGRGAIVRNAIVDKDVRIAPGARVGVDPEADQRPLPRLPERRRRDQEGRRRRGVSGEVALLTREYPPDVYGGAGVHVEYMARELAPLGRRHRALLGRRAAVASGRARRSSPTAPGTRSPGRSRTRRRCRRSRST